MDTLRLLTTPELDDFLRRVGDATARLINVESYRRRRQFFEGKGIDYSWMSAWSRRFTEYFEIYKLLGSKNFYDRRGEVRQLQDRPRKEGDSLRLLEREHTVQGEAALAHQAWSEAGSADHHLRSREEAVVRSR
jgi:hypothetical protein